MRGLSPFVTLLALLAAACRESSDGRRPARPSAERGAPLADSAARADSVRRIVREIGVDGDLRPECYKLEWLRDAPAVTANVREVHDERCGGDPATAPRVSTVQWNPRTGTVVTDYWGLAEGREDTLPRAGRVAAARRLAARAAVGPRRDAPAQPAPSDAGVDTDDPCPRAESQRDLTLCADSAARRADAAMNAEYRRALAAARPERRTLLREAQRRWLAYRDAHCGYVASRYAGGSMFPMQQLFCRAGVAEERARDLRGDTDDDVAR